MINQSINFNQLFCMSFLVGFVLFEGTSPLKNVLALMVCLGKKKFGSTSAPHDLFLNWSLIWSIYIPVSTKYLHLSSLFKQTIFFRSFENNSHRKYLENLWFLDSDHSFFLNLERNLLVKSLINLKFPVTANFKRSTEEFCLLRDDEWRYVSQKGM